MNEGLNILVALLAHQWTQLWPQPVNAWAEILNGLFQRLQKRLKCYRGEQNTQLNTGDPA
jgi:type VI secretion system protein VasL